MCLVKHHDHYILKRFELRILWHAKTHNNIEKNRTTLSTQKTIVCNL